MAMSGKAALLRFVRIATLAVPLVAVVALAEALAAAEASVVGLPVAAVGSLGVEASQEAAVGSPEVSVVAQAAQVVLLADLSSLLPRPRQTPSLTLPPPTASHPTRSMFAT